MVCASSISPGADCLCVFREDPEKQIGAGGLFFGYGSEPPEDAVCSNGIALALHGAAGFIADSIDRIIESRAKVDLYGATVHLESTMKAANRKIWELGQTLGQGIYVGGVVFYITGLRYTAIAWGGAEAYCLGADAAQPLTPCSKDELVYDALGQSEFWKGRFLRGDFPLYGSLVGLSGIPESNSLDALVQPNEQGANAADRLRTMLSQTGIPPAVIEIHW